MIIKRQVELVLFILLLCISSTVLASDVKTYPGSGCQPVDPSYPHALNGWGWITNLDSAGNRSYRCPIVRDNELQSNSAIEGFWVRANVTDASKTLSCWLIEVNSDGNNPKSRVRSTSGSGQQTLSYGQFFGSFNGVNYMLCTIPYGSSVLSYRIQEQ